MSEKQAIDFEQVSSQLLVDIFNKFKIVVDEKDPIMVQYYLNKLMLKENLTTNNDFLKEITAQINNSEVSTTVINNLAQVKQSIEDCLDKVSSYLEKDMVQTLESIMSHIAPTIQGKELENIQYLFTVQNSLDRLTNLSTTFDSSAKQLKTISWIIVGTAVVNIVAMTGFWSWMFLG